MKNAALIAVLMRLLPFVLVAIQKAEELKNATGPEKKAAAQRLLRIFSLHEEVRWVGPLTKDGFHAHRQPIVSRMTGVEVRQ